MALQHLRSSTANKRPTPAAMSDGQLAMNTNLASPGLFLKDSNGDLVKIGPVHVGTTAPNATPGAGGQAGNSKGEQWLDTTGGVYVFKIYDGTNWRSETGTFVDVSGDTMTGALGIIAGSAASPGLFFSGDTNSGLYSPGADQVAVATNGTQRLTVDTAATTSTLPVVHPLGAVGTPSITFTGDLNTGFWSPSADVLAASTAGSERARIDSSGRLLVGTSTARSNINILDQTDLTPSVQFEGQSTSNRSTGLSIINYSQSDYGSAFTLGASNSNTLGTNTLVESGGDVGVINFVGADGTRFVSCAAIIAMIDGTPGANDMPGRLVFSTTADGAATPTERMRIDSAGALKASTNGTYKFPGGVTEITHNDASSSVQLIASNTSFTGDAVTISTYRNTVNDSYKFLSCIRQGFAVALEIRDDGDVYNVNGTYGSLSDAKLKENIVDANSQWDDIRQLRVRNYNFKPETNNSTHKQIGVIAQEIEDVSPGLVNTVPDRDEDGNDLGTVTKSVNYSVLYMKAVKALQEAMERIEQLEASNADLLARVTALETA